LLAWKVIKLTKISSCLHIALDEAPIRRVFTPHILNATASETKLMERRCIATTGNLKMKFYMATEEKA
jgi:hypothetical protein